MRSIISTNLMAAAFALPSVPALAQEFQGECYARSYSADHLARSPNQTVAALSIRFKQSDGGGYAGLGLVSATMADTPATRAEGVAGKTIEQFTLCEPLNRPWNGGAGSEWIKVGVMTCFAECDAGMFQVVKSTDGSITIKTNGLALGETDGCGGSTTLADRGNGPGGFVTTSYRLDLTGPEVCGP